MWNDNRTGIEPGRWPIKVCVLTLLAGLLATGGLGISAQERRPRPKIIIVHDNPGQELGGPRGDAPATEKYNSEGLEPASAREPPLEPSIKVADTQSGSVSASKLPQQSAPALPPLPEVPSFPAVDKPAPRIDLPQDGNAKGTPALGPKRDSSSERSTLSKRGTPDGRRSGPRLQLPPLADNLQKNGAPGGRAAGPSADALSPIPFQQNDSAEGWKKDEQGNRVMADGVTSGTQPLIFVAGRKKEESANQVTGDHVVSAVQPVSYSTAELAEARLGGKPLIVVDSAASPPVYYGTTGEKLPVWQIVGLSVAVTFLLAITSLALSLLLLTLRQQSGGNPGSVIRFEVAQPAGGNFMLPFPTMPQASPTGPPTNPPVEREAPLRGSARVADFAEDILGAAAFGPILGETPEEREAKQSEREDSILQQIFEDNVALQKKEA